MLFRGAETIISRNLFSHMELPIQTASSKPLAGLITIPFGIAVALLGAAAILAGPVSTWMDFQQGKAALPLKKPLGALDVEGLLPYRAIERQVLDSTVVEALGTDQYINWVLEDTSVSQTDPLRYAHLFVTYDTGGVNLVPHTPDECRLGAGYQPAQPHENIDIHVPMTIPIRLCTFLKTAVFNREEVSVAYTFHCNGKFVATRNGVRLLINDLSNRHAYFSKVEVSFPRATREQSLQGAAKMLERLLPVLVKDHFPDFESAESTARKSG
jgi:hypothetical protein